MDHTLSGGIDMSKGNHVNRKEMEIGEQVDSELAYMSFNLELSQSPYSLPITNQ